MRGDTPAGVALNLGAMDAALWGRRLTIIHGQRDHLARVLLGEAWANDMPDDVAELAEDGFLPAATAQEWREDTEAAIEAIAEEIAARTGWGLAAIQSVLTRPWYPHSKGCPERRQRHFRTHGKSTPEEVLWPLLCQWHYNFSLIDSGVRKLRGARWHSSARGRG